MAAPNEGGSLGFAHVLQDLGQTPGDVGLQEGFTVVYNKQCRHTSPLEVHARHQAFSNISINDISAPHRHGIVAVTKTKPWQPDVIYCLTQIASECGGDLRRGYTYKNKAVFIFPPACKGEAICCLHQAGYLAVDMFSLPTGDPCSEAQEHHTVHFPVDHFDNLPWSQH